MTRIPDAVAVASLDTHRLIVAVPNEGPADIACNLPRQVAAHVLRQLANSIEGPAGACDTALATAAPCPIHDAPIPAPETQPTASDWVTDVRAALAFNKAAQHSAVITLRDVLLDTAPRTPEQALAAARVLLAAHTRELSALARQHTDDYRNEHGINRGTRGLLTGMASIRRRLDDHANSLDDRTGQ